ncbi:hypothetical protein DFH08DRAFT_946821 [Mycena albidolilacea]|uniref:RRM domain-containing protein n=1 Tax=Mycena albidolilacea TaxID=1033008 RepID=A0AAD7F6K9_9AGAR|nr:hypothetical protein DFH08DRAFT_946821 [Mycena albidolilacea]
MLKYSTARQLICRRVWCRANSYSPSNTPTTGLPLDQENRPRRNRAHREFPSGPPPEQLAPHDLETQRPYFVPPEAFASARAVHGLSVCIHNVPPQALIGEVLDIVLAGPIFRVDDLVRRGFRTVAVTFFHVSDANAFYQDATRQKIDLFGHQLEFSWQKGVAPPWNRTMSRSIIVWDQGRLGTTEEILNYLGHFGPIDRIALMKEKGADRAFVNYLSVKSGCWAADELRKTGATVSLMHDRCWVAAASRATALKTGSRTVILREIPPQTTLSELCDRIRGGLIHRINYSPEGRVCFVHFTEHSSAAYFLQHALYEGIILHGRRLSPAFVRESERLANFLALEVNQGATRCLAIEGIVNPDMLRNDCLQYGHVERVVLSESMSHVAFTHIQHALKASRMLPTKLGYEGLKISFARDPCAAPYPQDMNHAAALQAEIASLLLPSTAVRPPE